MTSAPTSKTRLLTPEEFEAMPNHARYELIDGVLRERHLSTYTGVIASRIARAIGPVVDAQHLGDLGDSASGLQIFPDRPRKVVFPDVMYISHARLPGGFPKTGWLKVAPELVVEVISPGDNANEVDEKVHDYFAAGVLLVWVVYPRTKSVAVHHPDGVAVTISQQATITGEDVIPGFAATVSTFFPD